MAASDIKDKRSCCIYNRAFIEHISLLLEEPGAQEEVRDKLLGEGKYNISIYFFYLILILPLIANLAILSSYSLSTLLNY